MNTWWVFRGSGEPHDGIARLPSPPPWRTFDGRDNRTQRPEQARTYQADEETLNLVNTAIYLRRPLLVTGQPGVGKSTLAYAIAHELGLGPVLRWPITSRTTVRDGLYRYDAIGRIEEHNLRGTEGAGGQDPPDVGRFLRLGPLGTALAPSERERVLLVDEIDKSDIDLPNDLLDAFEEGEYEIPELSRLAEAVPQVTIGTSDGRRITVDNGYVRCTTFPIVVLTSNGERDFPPAFLRRCVRMELRPPDEARLDDIVRAHLGADLDGRAQHLVRAFLDRREQGELATDQLLNAVYLTRHVPGDQLDPERLANVVLQYLTELS
ncbi:AAA family ATPase [Micromonospora humi]|uniref:AAA domain (Dynein-related subfamily) n=1 Tax=Micromonospora humi TaxID=745366 RepID=A0A1C5GSQ0_9ACTN|nr:MoxR family ATPase [Micromonospora humi]SCG36822.1 AAA domain (dynein-related subfamily) [Micromonospora humi]